MQDRDYGYEKIKVSAINMNRLERLMNRLSLFFLCLYILTLYVISYDENLNIYSHAVFIVYTAVTVFLWSYKNRFKFDMMHYILLLFGFLATISFFWSPDKALAGQSNLTLYQLILFAFLVRASLNSNRDIFKVIKAIYYGGMLMCLYAFIFYGMEGIYSKLMSGERLGAEINQINAFGLYSCITFLLALYFGLIERKRLHLLLSVFPLLFTFGSGSRKAILILIISVLLLLILFWDKKYKKMLLIVSISGLTAFVILYLTIFRESFERFIFFINFVTRTGYVDSALLLRGELLKFGLTLFVKKPIFGYGPEQFHYLFLTTFGNVRATHNTYVQLLVSFGIAGFSMYYGLYLYILRRLRGSSLARLLFILFIVFLINDTTSSMMLHKFTYLFFGIGCSFIYLNNRRTVGDGDK